MEQNSLFISFFQKLKEQLIPWRLSPSPDLKDRTEKGGLQQPDQVYCHFVVLAGKKIVSKIAHQLFLLNFIFSGLKCYNQEGSSARMELECDWLGGADYCAKVTGPNVSAKTCAIEMITDAFKELSLTSSGCRTHGDYTFCLCSTNLCNA